MTTEPVDVKALAETVRRHLYVSGGAAGHDALEALLAEVDRARAAVDLLRLIGEQQQKTLAKLRRNGIVFDGTGGDWEKVALTIYTDLCEVDTWATQALDGLAAAGSPTGPPAPIPDSEFIPTPEEAAEIKRRAAVPPAEEACPTCDGTGCVCLRWRDWQSIEQGCHQGCPDCGLNGCPLPDLIDTDRPPESVFEDFRKLHGLAAGSPTGEETPRPRRSPDVLGRAAVPLAEEETP